MVEKWLPPHDLEMSGAENTWDARMWLGQSGIERICAGVKSFTCPVVLLALQVLRML
jgi:hypothetical protein